MAFGQKPYPVPDPEEVATIIVGAGAATPLEAVYKGAVPNVGRYDDWETVYVQLRWKDFFPIFQFTAAERDPNPPLWDRIQFAPPDPVAIYLGGQLAITGNILRRQTAYDKGSHAVQLFGVGRTYWAGRAHMEPQDWSGQTLFQIADACCRKYGVKVIPIGNLDQTPFKTLQNEVGETVFAFIERIARPRGAVFAPNHLGQFLLIGDHSWQPIWNLIEGKNILRLQSVISLEGTYKDVRVYGQSGGDNKQSMTSSSEQEGFSEGFQKMPFSPMLVPAEQPVWGKGELMTRARHEDLFLRGTYITANVTVQGWLRGGIALWMPGDKVTVWSPMAMFDNTELKIQAATFTQDSQSGTLTLLELVAPWLLKDTMNADVRGVVGDAPGKNQTQTPAPPDAEIPDPPPVVLPDTITPS